MIGTIDINVNAAHPNVPLAPVFSWRGSASRINVEGVPSLCGSWYVSAVSIAVATPDGKTAAYPCQRTSNGVYSTTIEATDTPGKSANGITITATDEEGKDFVLGRGDLYILDGAAIPAPGDVSWTVRLLSSKPENPKDGDAYFGEDGTLMVYSGGSWRNPMPSATVPTKVSAFENDAGYITSKQVKPGSKEGYAADAERADKALSADKAGSVAWSGVTDKPTKVSEFDNDAGYIAKDDGPVLLVEDINGEKTAATVGSRKSDGAVGASSLANGRSVTASGNYSHAEGTSTTASGLYSHAEGSGTTASGNYSHAEGTSTIASGQYSHAEGSGTTASVFYSHAEGGNTKASGNYSHAEGSGTKASGNYSHAEGSETKAEGAGSHAEGSGTTASGDYSHTEGFKAQTKPDDKYAYSWNGDETRAEPYSSHGKGTFNVNPEGGLSGFYIGEQKLSEVMAKKTDLDSLAAKVDAANTALEEVA